MTDLETAFHIRVKRALFPIGLLLVWFGTGISLPLDAQSNVQNAGRRILATSSLAAKEYGLGVNNGVVLAEEEVKEARLFLAEALKSAAELPDRLSGQAVTLLSSMESIVAHLGNPGQVQALADSLHSLLSSSIVGLNERIPATAPDTETGSRVYAAACASCHGATGHGDGVASGGLSPAPSNLTDAAALADQSPLDFYRKVLIGVSGTAMAPFEGTLTDEEIWAVVWRATALRHRDSNITAGRKALSRACVACFDENLALPFPAYLPSYLTDPEQIARLTDNALHARVMISDSLGGEPLDSIAAAAVVGFVRTLPFAQPFARGPGGTFAEVRAEVLRGLRLAKQGQPQEAVTKLVDAYAVFEAVEAELGVRNRRLMGKVELAFSELRSNVSTGSSDAQLAESYRSFDRLLDQAQGTLERRNSAAGFFMQSLLLLLREGVEALLIVGALAALVVRAGAPETKRAIWWGVGTALAASVVTAVLIEGIFRIGAARQELLEGITMLVAAGVLLFVSYWLISKVEVHRWRRFLANQGTRAVQQGSLFALAAASFLAVYREGFETVLFYKALIITAEGTGVGAIAAGAVLGGLALLVIYWLINRFGVKLPIRPFFATTSAVLLYMAFSFAGKGIAELQESNLLSTTMVDWAPHVPWMGIYPTTQSMVLQATIVGLVVAGLIWTFLVQPRISPHVIGPAKR